MTWVRHYKKKKSTARSVIKRKSKREKIKKRSVKAKEHRDSKKEKPADISPDKYFKLCNGKTIKSIEELALMLDTISDDDFSFHVSNEKNDFATWIKDVFDNEDLADHLHLLNDKKESQIALLKHTVSGKNNTRG